MRDLAIHFSTFFDWFSEHSPLNLKARSPPLLLPVGHTMEFHTLQKSHGDGWKSELHGEKYL